MGLEMATVTSCVKDYKQHSLMQTSFAELSNNGASYIASLA